MMGKHYERDEKQQWQDVATDQLLEWIISRSNTPLAQEGPLETQKSELTVRPSAAPVAGEAEIVELTEPVAVSPKFSSNLADSLIRPEIANIAKRVMHDAVIKLYVHHSNAGHHHF
jgi:hypothetical protein